MQKKDVNLGGDIKFHMIMMGRSGYDKDWCSCCRKVKSEWMTHHLSKEFDDEWSSEFLMWTTQDIAKAAIKIVQEISSYQTEGETEKQEIEKFKSAGDKELCIWPFVPISRNALPILHVLLGLGNKIMNEFWVIVKERIEKLHHDVVQA